MKILSYHAIEIAKYQLQTLAMTPPPPLASKIEASHEGLLYLPMIPSRCPLQII